MNVALRQEFDLYANVRPARSFAGLRTRYDNVDLLVVRENTQGEYSGIEHFIDPTKSAAEAISIITRFGSDRIIRFAFEYARANGRKLVTLVHKANILKMTSGLFLQVGREIAEGYPDIAFSDIIVDNCAMQLVRDPTRFDVIVTTNLFGDILSDLTAGLVGGLGLVPGRQHRRERIGVRGRARDRARHRRTRDRQPDRCHARGLDDARAARPKRARSAARGGRASRGGRGARSHARSRAARQRPPAFTDRVIAELVYGLKSCALAFATSRCDDDPSHGNASAHHVHVPHGIGAAMRQVGFAPEAIVGHIENDRSLVPRGLREPAREVVGDVSLAPHQHRCREIGVQLSAHRPVRPDHHHRRLVGRQRLDERAANQRHARTPGKEIVGEIVAGHVALAEERGAERQEHPRVRDGDREEPHHDRERAPARGRSTRRESPRCASRRAR